MSVKLILDDGEYVLDLDTFMLSEAMALEDDWGFSTVDFAAKITSGSPPLKAIGAMVWLVKVRSLAAAEGIPFRAAAEKLPVATFDTNLTAIKVEEVSAAANPTPGGTRTRTTRTTRTTSAAKRAKSA